MLLPILRTRVISRQNRVLAGPSLTVDLVHALAKSSLHPYEPGNMTAHFIDEQEKLRSGHSRSLRVGASWQTIQSLYALAFSKTPKLRRHVTQQPWDTCWLERRIGSIKLG